MQINSKNIYNALKKRGKPRWVIFFMTPIG